MGVMKRDIPDEVRTYKEKFFFGLTARQMLCGAIGIGLAAPTAILGWNKIPDDIIMWVLILEMAPAIAIGWFQYNGMPAEKIAKRIFAFYAGTQRRKVKFKSEERMIHEQLVQIQLEADTTERQKEIEEEKRQKMLAKRHKSKKRGKGNGTGNNNNDKP